MKKPREELQEKLEELIGNRNVYFQQPEGFKIKYPCIVYKLSLLSSQKADNTKYLSYKRYEITLIDKDPDSDLVNKIYDLDKCYFDRSYQSDNLNHWIFEIYF